MALMEKMKEYLEKSVEASKDAFSKAGDAVQDFGDKSVLKIEIKQINSRLNREYRSLGTQIYRLYSENHETEIAFSDARISGILEEIGRLQDEISRRETALNGSGQKSPDSPEKE